MKPSLLSGHFWHDLWIGFFIVIIALGIFLGQGLVIGFGVMGLVAGGISLIWNRLALEEVTYDRELSERRVFLKEEISMTVSLTNRKPIPLAWIHVEDGLPDALEVIDGDVSTNVQPSIQSIDHSTSMAWYERIKWRYRLKCSQRGLHKLGPARIESGDPFGFLRNMIRVPIPDTVLVYPHVVPLQNLGIPADRPLGEVRKGLPIFVDLSRPSGLREYVLGDPLKTIDWKATAKSQTLQVRTYEPSSTYTVIIVVAVDTSTPHWDSYDPENLERVISVAASMATFATDERYTVGLFSNDMPITGNKPMTVSPSRGKDQLATILGTLATIRSYAIAPMSKQLMAYFQRFPLGSTLVVCTSFIHDEFVDTLNSLRGQGFKIVILYVGNDEYSPMSDGIIVHNIRPYLDKLEEAGEPVTG
jgi:uncharacterized protein (DUF58 family)